MFPCYFFKIHVDYNYCFTEKVKSAHVGEFSMVFSSLVFLFVFLPVSLLAYRLVGKKYKNLCLFLFSILFYAWGEPKYIFLMMGEILFDFAAGRLLARQTDRKKQKIILAVSICFVLGLLCFFKYAALLCGTVNALFPVELPVVSVALPIGISFYTFESVSYLVDIYRGEAPAQTSLLNFGTYLSLFPHLIAGPIVKYSDIEPQLAERAVTREDLAYGCRRFCVGLFKKVLLADQLAQIISRLQYYDERTVLGAWIGALAFTFQIYFDFSGYSDMAIGLGRLFGFRLPENFNLPYLSGSASEFWRRWHMTLGGWFRRYLYFPLGGNRCSKLKNVRNLAIVWTLTGLWHGASWNFAFWGAYWGFLIICEKLFLGRLLDRIPRFFRWLYAFLAAVVGWVFFSNTDLLQAFTALSAMFGFAPAAGRVSLYTAVTGGALLLVSALGSSPLPAAAAEKLRGSGRAGKIVWDAGFAALFLVTLSFLVRNSYSPFLYFRF